MDIAATLVECGLQSALIVDDAYELPSSAKISAQAKSRFVRAIRDNAPGAAALRGQFPDLNTEADDAIIALLSDDGTLLKVWTLYRDSPGDFGWCKETFAEFEQDRDRKRAPLLPLEQFLRSKCTQVDMRFELPDETDIGSFGLVFIDFFLVEQETPDQALDRAAKIGKKFATAREKDGKRFRPLVFLISTRAETTQAFQKRFRADAKIKGSFFRFVKKDDLAVDRFPPRLERQLQGYASAMLLGNYLESFYAGALASLDRLDELELTDLALLNYLRIEGENEKLGNYLNWLLSEAISGGIQSDTRLQAASNALDSLVNHPLDGHIVSPTNLLFEIYSRAVCRYDVRDRAGEPRTLPVAFGDIFLMEETKDENKITHYVAVISPSSNFIRQADTGYHVLCVFGKSAADPKLSTKDLLSENLFDKDLHLLEVEESDRKEYRLVRWQAKAVRSFALGELRDAARFRRLARLQPLFANQLNEFVLRDLGRVGVPTTPAVLRVLDATVTLRVKGASEEIKTAEKGMFAAIQAQKRSGKDEKRVICFTVAFTDELKALALSMRDAAGDDAAKLDNIIKACDEGKLAEVAQTGNPCSVGNLIKIFIGEIKDGQQSVCTILITPAADGG